SYATPASLNTLAKALDCLTRSSTGNATNHASTMERQIDVHERCAGLAAKNSTHGVRPTHSERTARLRADRAIVSRNPPILSTHFKASIASSTHNMDGVLMVDPLKTPSDNLPPDVRRKTLGIGHGGT